jgi:hypothetical protein
MVPMAVRSRIGLRQVRSMKPGETIWDASLTGFGARRQKSDAVVYVLFYRTAEAANVGSRSAGTALRGRPKRRGRRQGAY